MEEKCGHRGLDLVEDYLCMMMICKSGIILKLVNFVRY